MHRVPVFKSLIPLKKGVAFCRRHSLQRDMEESNYIEEIDIPKSLAPIFSKKRPRQALLAHPNNEKSNRDVNSPRVEARPSYCTENPNFQRNNVTQWQHQQTNPQHSTTKPFRSSTRMPQPTTAKPEQRQWTQKPNQPPHPIPMCNQPVQYPTAGASNITHQNQNRDTNQMSRSRNQNSNTTRETFVPGYNQKRGGGQPNLDSPMCAQQPWGTPCLPKKQDSTSGADFLVESNSKKLENNQSKSNQTREKSSFQVEQRNSKSSPKLITATIQGMKHWSQYREQVQLTFEVFGMLNSAMSFNESCAAKEFLLRDEKDSITCSFYEIDRELQRMTRGQWYRCVGKLDQHMEKFVCVSIRKASDVERKLIKAAVNVSDGVMRNCIFREANEI